jgi:hypothetical protein
VFHQPQQSTRTQQQRQQQLPPRPNASGRVYVLSKQEADNTGTVITGTLSLQCVPVHVLFDSGASHSFISSSMARKLQLEPNPTPDAFAIGLPTGEVIRCPTMHRECPLVVGGETFSGDLVQFDLSEFDVILGMDWMTRHKAKLDCEKHEVILKDSKGNKVCFYGET